MLARSYRYFGKYENAATAFDKASPIVQADPLALSEYADTLARISGTGFRGEAKQLLERALALDPREPFTLMVAGQVAFERSDFQSAQTTWTQSCDPLHEGADQDKVMANADEGIQRGRS